MHVRTHTHAYMQHACMHTYNAQTHIHITQVQEKARQAAEAMKKSAKYGLKSGADGQNESGAEAVVDAAPKNEDEQSENKSSSDTDAEKPPPSECCHVYICMYV